MPTTHVLAEVILPTTGDGNIAMVYSAPEEEAERLWNISPLDRFTNPAKITFHGLFASRVMAHDRQHISMAGSNEAFGDLRIARDDVERLISVGERPIEDCQRAVAKLQALGTEMNLPRESVERMSAAIQQYATYVKPEPTTGDQCHAEVGKCESTPHFFREFAASWHGLEVNTDIYWSSIGGHQVNIWSNDVVIDWTARQFPQLREHPYPLVYRRGDKIMPDRFRELGEYLS